MPKFTIGIVGMGLMGGSFAKAFSKDPFFKVIGIDQNKEVLERAKREGAIWEGYVNPREILSQLDLVLLCIYPKDILSFVTEYQEIFKKEAILSDIAGIKRCIMKEIETVLREDITFIGGHPMAGREKAGFDYADASIFQGARYILTPCNNQDRRKVRLLESLLEDIGVSEITVSTGEEHDKRIAYTSHLPHILALLLMNHQEEAENKKYAGGSFRDATRVAMMNAKLWTELFDSNREYLSETIRSFEQELQKMRLKIENQEWDKVSYMIEEGRRRREAF